MAAASPHRFRAAETLPVDPRRVRRWSSVAPVCHRAARCDAVPGRLGFWRRALTHPRFLDDRHSGVTEIHRQYLAQDEGGFAILVLTIVSACASVGAVFAWLEIATRAETFALRGLAFLLPTIMLSWAFIHTMFAFHYAHEFYAEHYGLIFPTTLSRPIGTSSIWPFPSARRRKCRTWRSARNESAVP